MKVYSGTGISVKTCAVYHIEKEKLLFLYWVFSNRDFFSKVIYIMICIYICILYIYSTYSVIWCQICIYLTSSINLKAAKSQSFWETQNARDGVFCAQKNVRDPNESGG